MELPPGTIIAVGPIIIEDGKVLLNREIKNDGTESPIFMLPGGTVENMDSTLEEECYREAMEEMGMTIEIIKPLRTMLVKRPGKETYAILVHYLARRTSEINPGQETLEWGWYDIDNLPKNCAPNIAQIIDDVKKEL
ncbi:MAG: NUDIX hydrolase [Candidatus Magasanikbacteria bacterium]|nr:NUDIX hydrolase [Candidatus Magasanikbacteria bacterium]